MHTPESATAQIEVAPRRYDRPTPRGAGPDSGASCELSQDGLGAGTRARAALCERLGLRSIVAVSGDGLAGVGGIPLPRAAGRRAAAARGPRGHGGFGRRRRGHGRQVVMMRTSELGGPLR